MFPLKCIVKLYNAKATYCMILMYFYDKIVNKKIF